MRLRVNGEERDLPEEAVDERMPLLWVLRDVLGLTGTKFGCGVGDCGACTVHVDGAAARACLTPLAAVRGRSVRTVEGLADGGRLHALQQAWLAHQVPQCGYCQSGALMAAAALLARTRQPDDADIDAALTNLCRCGSYGRMRAAIRSAAAALRDAPRRPAPKGAPDATRRTA